MAEESIARLFGEPPPSRVLDRASIEAEADEGLLLAEYATRMRVKNRIVVDTMRASDGVDLDAWIDEVRLSLGRLRLEAESSARRMVSERDAAAEVEGLATHEHDYRHRDAGNLERRRLVYTALARRLIRWENDDERVRALLAAARDDAYGELRSAATATASRARPSVREDRALLEERLRLIAAVDLPALAADCGRSEPGAPEPVALEPVALEPVALEPTAARTTDRTGPGKPGRPRSLLGRLGTALRRRR